MPADNRFLGDISAENRFLGDISTQKNDFLLLDAYIHWRSQDSLSVGAYFVSLTNVFEHGPTSGQSLLPWFEPP